ncbi:MAG: hypothetical protein WB471_12865 [Nocardioides sp.]
MTSPDTWAARRIGAGAIAGVALLLVLAAFVGVLDGDPAPAVASQGPRAPSSGVAPPERIEAPESVRVPAPAREIFAANRTLVAYYGTAGSGALGVLGEGAPDQVIGRLTRAAQAFARPGRPVQVVYELIVTIADAVPGPGGDYNHDIPRAQVERYVRAAHRHDALLLLDLQPGRAHFGDVARRWTWALRDPRVGLALDPEWRMRSTDVPGRVIGSVDAAEVNEVSLWLANLQRRLRLPQKLFVLHQFRTSMIERIDRVAVRQRLATVQHVDGFGTRAEKVATYRAVLRADKFYPGFKLFYDEDVGLMRPADVLRIRPHVRFVSYQ